MRVFSSIDFKLSTWKYFVEAKIRLMNLFLSLAHQSKSSLPSPKPPSCTWTQRISFPFVSIKKGDLGHVEWVNEVNGEAATKYFNYICAFFKLLTVNNLTVWVMSVLVALLELIPNMQNLFYFKDVYFLNSISWF